MPTSLKQTMRVRRARVARLPGFTLVEVLVVIAIIGVLVGLAVPAVNLARRSIQQRAIALECLAIAQAVEAYHNKYDDYPPDGSDVDLLRRHLRKAFTNISSTELTILGIPTAGATPAPFPLPGSIGGEVVASGNLPVSAMDPSEALVFFLGGFSNDPVYPFSGKGGPIYISNSSGAQIKSNEMDANSTFQYNPDRQSPLYDFKQAQLTLDASSGKTLSSDDGIAGGAPDLMPAYHPGGKKMPFLYFDSRTYQRNVAGVPIANHFNAGLDNIAFAYRSTAINTKYAPTSDPNKFFRFINEKTFQIVSAGLDDSYGGEMGLFYLFKDASSESTGNSNSGDSLDLLNPTAAPKYTRFLGANASTSQLDNVTNFSQGTLEDSLSN